MKKKPHIEHRVEILDKLKELGFEEITTYSSGKGTEPETAYLLWMPETDLRIVVSHIQNSCPSVIPISVMKWDQGNPSQSGWHQPNLASLYDAHDILYTVSVKTEHPPFDGDNFLKHVKK